MLFFKAQNTYITMKLNTQKNHLTQAKTPTTGGISKIRQIYIIDNLGNTNIIIMFNFQISQ